MIFYFSGTGNSKYVAQRIADALGVFLLSMNAWSLRVFTSMVGRFLANPLSV